MALARTAYFTIGEDRSKAKDVKESMLEKMPLNIAPDRVVELKENNRAFILVNADDLPPLPPAGPARPIYYTTSISQSAALCIDLKADARKHRGGFSFPASIAPAPPSRGAKLA